MIELDNISKNYNNIVLFKDLSLKLETGKKILIQGPNGSGKSVLLKMLVGYSQISNGKIFIENKQLGKDLEFIPNSGISINAPEFCSNLTGMDNLLYLSKIRKIATKEEIIMLAKKFHLDKDLNKKYKTYSLGMKQKMRIIQALMDKPKYLILDEPFDNLDKESQEQAIELLNEFINKDTMLIFTSHNSEYEKFADNIYKINDYKLEKIKWLIYIA